MKAAILGLAVLMLAGCQKPAPLDKATYRAKVAAAWDKAGKVVLDESIATTKLFKDSQSMPREERRKFVLDESRKGGRRINGAMRVALDEMWALTPPVEFGTDHNILVRSLKSYLDADAAYTKDPKKNPMPKESDLDAVTEAMKRMGIQSTPVPDDAFGRILEAALGK